MLYSRTPWARSTASSSAQIGWCRRAYSASRPGWTDIRNALRMRWAVSALLGVGLDALDLFPDQPLGDLEHALGDDGVDAGVGQAVQDLLRDGVGEQVEVDPLERPVIGHVLAQGRRGRRGRRQMQGRGVQRL